VFKCVGCGSVSDDDSKPCHVCGAYKSFKRIETPPPPPALPQAPSSPPPVASPFPAPAAGPAPAAEPPGPSSSWRGCGCLLLLFFLYWLVALVLTLQQPQTKEAPVSQPPGTNDSVHQAPSESEPAQPEHRELQALTLAYLRTREARECAVYGFKYQPSGSRDQGTGTLRFFCGPDVFDVVLEMNEHGRWAVMEMEEPLRNSLFGDSYRHIQEFHERRGTPQNYVYLSYVLAGDANQPWLVHAITPAGPRNYTIEFAANGAAVVGEKPAEALDEGPGFGSSLGEFALPLDFETSTLVKNAFAEYPRHLPDSPSVQRIAWAGDMLVIVLAVEGTKHSLTLPLLRQQERWIATRTPEPRAIAESRRVIDQSRRDADRRLTIPDESPRRETVEQREDRYSIPQLPVSPPTIRKRVAPNYPEVARRLRQGGTVILEATISAGGDVQRILVVRGANYGLTEAAIAALGRSTFDPATRGGVRVEGTITITYEFKPN
jgi:TonB family protein